MQCTSDRQDVLGQYSIVYFEYKELSWDNIEGSSRSSPSNTALHPWMSPSQKCPVQICARRNTVALICSDLNFDLKKH